MKPYTPEQRAAWTDWTLVPWPYADGYPDCWAKRICGGVVYLTDWPEVPCWNHFGYVSSCGSDSDCSYSGCFYGHPEIRTLQDAKDALDAMMKRFNGRLCR